MSPNTETLQTAAPLWRGVAAAARFGIMRVRDFVRAIRHRRDLASLAQFDDRMLADIGLNRSDVRSALAEPFWRDPGSVLIARAGERRGRPRGRSGGQPASIVTAPSIVPEHRREPSSVA
jgi:uncharacterized protein YjiS (DUF1127 family)